MTTPTSSQPLLSIQGLKMHFPIRKGVLMNRHELLRAVDGVDLDIGSGETVGLVGESGCGKSTLGKCVVRLLDPSAGSIQFGDTNLAALSRRAMKPHRRQLQMIFQDPVESLNSRHTVGQIIEEPFVIHRQGDRENRRRHVLALLDKVGLPSASYDRYPFEFSGGQRQRIGIARALALNPRMIICDEPVSALDVSIQSQVLNLLLDLQRDLGLTYLFIAHNLAVVKHISDRIAVMYLGRIVELADAESLYRDARHPYTRALISAIPEPDPRRTRDRIVLKGDVPSPINPPSGCPFHTRCPYVQDRCRVDVPLLREPVPGHQVACHFDL